MLKIRLQRTGRTNDPSFRIVVVEHTAGPKTGKVVERIGAYNPKTKHNTLDAERAKHWLSVGAKASGTVHNMLVSLGVISEKKVNVLPRKNIAQKDAEQTQNNAESEGGEQKPVGDVPAEENAEESKP